MTSGLPTGAMKLLRLLLPVLASVALFACRSSGVGQVLRNGSPAYARVIRVESELDGAELARRVAEKLEQEGYRCSGAMILRTEPRQSGSRWTRFTVEVVGGVASASGEWAEAAGEELFWRVARNTEGSAEQVFLELRRMMLELPSVGVTYLFE